MRAWVACVVACGSRTGLDAPLPITKEPPPAPVVCVPSNEPEHIVATSELEPGGLTVTKDWVYFGASNRGDIGAVFRVPIAGGAIEKVADGYSTGLLANDGRFVYFPKAHRFDNGRVVSTTIVALPIDGGDPLELPNTTNANGVTLPRSNGTPGVFWVTVSNDHGRIVRWIPNVGTVTILGPTSISNFVVDETYVYFATWVALNRVAIGGGDPEVLARDVTREPLATKDGAVYFLRHDNVVRWSGGIETASSITFDGIVQLGSMPGALAVDGPWVYLERFGLQRAPFDRCPSAGPGLRPACSEQADFGEWEPYDVAIADCVVYWTKQTGANPNAIVARHE